MKICNLCGKEFDENEKMYPHTAENGVEYYLCESCEKDGVEVCETAVYYICKNCGYAHTEKEYSGVCKFCGHTQSAEKVGLTKAEEELLNSEPEKIYEEKLGVQAAEKIAAWSDSKERKEVAKMQKRDRNIDTVFVVAIIIGYFMLDFAIRGFLGSKPVFMALLAMTVLEIISPPVFKVIDKKHGKNSLPIWSIFVAMAVFSAAYVLILLFI